MRQTHKQQAMDNGSAGREGSKKIKLQHRRKVDEIVVQGQIAIQIVPGSTRLEVVSGNWNVHLIATTQERGAVERRNEKKSQHT